VERVAAANAWRLVVELVFVKIHLLAQKIRRRCFHARIVGQRLERRVHVDHWLQLAHHRHHPAGRLRLKLNPRIPGEQRAALREQLVTGTVERGQLLRVEHPWHEHKLRAEGCVVAQPARGQRNENIVVNIVVNGMKT
jgi:hypothetical protein